MNNQHSKGKQTLHMIGNAHIDPVWLWLWQEGLQEVKATFRSALNRMQEYDDFVFTASSAAFYEWVERNDPQMFDEIRARIVEGRWHVVGGWWVEPDCNLPSGESFVRHALYSQRYFREKFGITASVGYSVDSFGHHGMLPQILKKSGMDYYVFMRPMPNEKDLPAHIFWWESDDGSRVLAIRLLHTYTPSGEELENHIRRCAAEIRSPLDAMVCFYGIGNHGGGPTKENIERIRALNRQADLPNLVFSSPSQFFRCIAVPSLQLPVVHDDLQHHARGGYAAHSGIKRCNRLAENRLLAAEKFCTIAECALGKTGGSRRADDFKRAWRNVLFNQFHDILSGTCIEPAYDDARNAYGEAISIADRVLNDAIQSLSWRVHIEPEEGMKPIVVFNPHAWQSKTEVEIEIGDLQGTQVLLDDEGNVVPVQRVQSLATTHRRGRISFIADLPPLGYRTYRVAAPKSAQAFAPVAASDTRMENARFRLEFDPATGYVKRLFDRAHQCDIFVADAAKPIVIDDPSDTWAHNISRFDNVIGTFTTQNIRLVEHGPVKSVIRVVSTYGASRLIQEFALHNDLDYIQVHVSVDWHEQFKMLKLRFPLNLSRTVVTYEIPYGRIQREPNGEEEPYQSWLDVSGVLRNTNQPYGLSILNDGKYSADVNECDIGFTVLRSPIYAHHIPMVPEPDRLYAFIDQGIQEFNYALLPHAGSWEQAGTPRRAAELNQRAIALIETFHPDGVLPQRDSFIAVEPDNIIVSVVKYAEDNDDIVIRAYETNKIATRATIRLPHWARVIDALFEPCEIKTLRVPHDRQKPVTETNLIEW